MDLKKLVNKGVDSLSPYEPGKPIEDLEREIGIKNAIKLASNENPIGPSPKVLQSIDAILKETHRYPDGNATRLKDSIAKKFNTSPNQVTIGNGSNDIIEFIARSFLGPDDSAIYSEHDKSVEYLVLNMALARCKEVNEYLDWIHTHCIDDYKELASTPAKIHEYMELKVSVQNSFRLKNNVYHIDDMRKTPETIADAPPPPKLTRQPTQGKHDFTEQLSPAESRILFTDSICDNA